MKILLIKHPLLGITSFVIACLFVFVLFAFSNINSINSRLLSLPANDCNSDAFNTWLADNFTNSQAYYGTDNTLLISNLVADYPSNLKGQITLLASFYPKLSFVNSFIETSTINPTGETLPQEISINVQLDNLKLRKTQVIALNLAFQNINCYHSLKTNTGNDTVSIKGILNKEEFEAEIQKRYLEFTDAIGNNSEANFIYFPPQTDNTKFNLLNDAVEILRDSSITEVQMAEPQDLINIFKVASFNLNTEVFSSIQNLYYDPLKDNLVFNISEINTHIFNYLKQTNKILALNCSECSLAPVSKNFSLSQSYAPQVENINIQGGGQLNPVALEQLYNLNNAADKQGINIAIISAYRSYSNQISTFNYWVSKEIATGLSRSAAEIKANNYSAKPGQSEHQLGTTLDLRCNTCSSFDNSLGNMKLYDFLKSQAHKYGFVISYPDNKKELTGYNAEAWHIRYIGIENATRLFNLNYLSNSNEYYLTDFLIKYNLY